MNHSLPNPAQCERLLTHTFEWAYHGEAETGVVTARLQLPSFSRLQDYLSNTSLDIQHYDEFVDVMTSDWRRGAVTSYFHRTLNAGRLLTKVKDVKWDEPQLTVWIEHSSRLRKSINILERAGLEPIVPGQIAKHILQTLGAITGAISDQGSGSGPTVPTDAVTSDR